jgi:hypothetical protein
MQPRRHRSGASAARRALLLAAAVLAAAHCASAARLGPLGAASYKSRHQDGMLRVLALGDSITQVCVLRMHFSSRSDLDFGPAGGHCVHALELVRNSGLGACVSSRRNCRITLCGSHMPRAASGGPSRPP